MKVMTGLKLPPFTTAATRLTGIHQKEESHREERKEELPARGEGQERREEQLHL
jgi:hypothetical protein